MNSVKLTSCVVRAPLVLTTVQSRTQTQTSTTQKIAVLTFEFIPSPKRATADQSQTLAAYLLRRYFCRFRFIPQVLPFPGHWPGGHFTDPPDGLATLSSGSPFCHTKLLRPDDPSSTENNRPKAPLPRGHPEPRQQLLDLPLVPSAFRLVPVARLPRPQDQWQRQQTSIQEIAATII
jgi:hypothetical protein